MFLFLSGQEKLAIKPGDVNNNNNVNNIFYLKYIYYLKYFKLGHL